MNFRVDARANADFTDVLRWYARRRGYTVITRLWNLWQAGLTAIQANPWRSVSTPTPRRGWKCESTSCGGTATSSAIG